MQEKRVPNSITDKLPEAAPANTDINMSPEDKEKASQMLDFLEALLKDIRKDQEDQKADQTTTGE